MIKLIRPPFTELISQSARLLIYCRKGDYLLSHLGVYNGVHFLRDAILLFHRRGTTLTLQLTSTHTWWLTYSLWPRLTTDYTMWSQHQRRQVSSVIDVSHAASWKTLTTLYTYWSTRVSLIDDRLTRPGGPRSSYSTTTYALDWKRKFDSRGTVATGKCTRQ